MPEEHQSARAREDLFRLWAHETEFTYEEIVHLNEIFNLNATRERRLGEAQKNRLPMLHRQAFRDMLQTSFQLYDDQLTDRVIQAFSFKNEFGTNLEEFIRGMSVFLRGSVDDQIDFCFNVYDTKRDGDLEKSEIYGLLRNSIVKGASIEEMDEMLRDMIEITVMLKMDIDRDGKISKEDYRTAVKQNHLLLEVFGQFLPTQESIDSFLEEDTLVMYRELRTHHSGN